MKNSITPPSDTEETAKQTAEEKFEEFKKVESANDKLTEDNISTEAIDFEESSFLEKNKHAGQKTEAPKEEDEDNAEAYEQSFVDKEMNKAEEEDLSPEEAMDKVIREIADQPFEVAMSNLEVEKNQVVEAASGIFSSKGYFEKDYSLPFGGEVTMRSKTVNDYVDYTEYVRRLLLDPISQKEFDTFTQMRNLSYAIVAIDGDDISELSIDDKFALLTGMSEIKITAIINNTKVFWRITHLLLHPGLVDFLAQTPEE